MPAIPQPRTHTEKLEEQYCYETPMWAVALICSMFVTMGISCIALYINLDGFNSGFSEFIWPLLVLGVFFVIAGGRPLNWQPWKYFYADKIGIHFPSECPQRKTSEWLSVPWNKVGKIQKETFLGQKNGPAIELALNDMEINRYFKDVRQTRIFFRHDIRKNGYFKVGYSNIFKKPDIAVEILNKMKEIYS